MNNPTDAFTRNKFVDKCMSYIPDDPLIQAKYIYFLSAFVFLGLLGYGITAWYNYLSTLMLNYLFSGIFMTAIAFISAFGLKQTRNSYLAILEMKKMTKPIESVEEMQKIFNQSKNEATKATI